MDAAISCEVFRLHGGKVEAARSLFRKAREPWVDLSTGVSPWCYPLDALGPEALTRLPDAESVAALEAAAAESFGMCSGLGGAAEAAPLGARTDANVGARTSANAGRGAGAARCVIATPGSDLALRVLGRVFAGRRVAVVRPGYSGHVLAWGGASVTSISIDEIELAARDHDVVLLANPNNPDGRRIERDRLLAIAGQLASRSGTARAGAGPPRAALVVDEAFADLAPQDSLCGVLDDDRARAVIVFRSFGKFFGLAGVRLGFVICPFSAEQAFREALGDWPVSGPAAALGIAAYSDLEWQTMQRRRLTAAAERLDALLIRAGLAVVGGTALFRLARCSDADALFRHLAERGILTRPFSSDPTLLRVGLPADESQWQRLLLALHTRCAQ